MGTCNRDGHVATGSFAGKEQAIRNRLCVISAGGTGADATDTVGALRKSVPAPIMSGKSFNRLRDLLVCDVGQFGPRKGKEFGPMEAREFTRKTP